MHGDLFNGKPSVGVAARYVVYRNIFIEGAGYYYFDEKIKKMPWDADFTYGFGYFDWRSFRLSASYGNWGINRFPWNEKNYDYYGFMDGTFKLSFNYIW